MRYITGDNPDEQSNDSTIVILSTTDSGGKYLCHFKDGRLTNIFTTIRKKGLERGRLDLCIRRWSSLRRFSCMLHWHHMVEVCQDAQTSQISYVGANRRLRKRQNFE